MTSVSELIGKRHNTFCEALGVVKQKDVSHFAVNPRPRSITGTMSAPISGATTSS